MAAAAYGVFMGAVPGLTATMAVALFVPVTMALFIKRPSVSSAAVAMALGALGFVLFRVWPIPFPKEIVSLAMSFAGYVTFELLAKRRGSLALVWKCLCLCL